MRLIGREIGKLHLADIVHGDLTTSNMILRDRVAESPAELVPFSHILKELTADSSLGSHRLRAQFHINAC